MIRTNTVSVIKGILLNKKERRKNKLNQILPMPTHKHPGGRNASCTKDYAQDLMSMVNNFSKQEESELGGVTYSEELLQTTIKKKKGHRSQLRVQ